jgi:hypothetical protein
VCVCVCIHVCVVLLCVSAVLPVVPQYINIVL